MGGILEQRWAEVSHRTGRTSAGVGEVGHQRSRGRADEVVQIERTAGEGRDGGKGTFPTQSCRRQRTDDPGANRSGEFEPVRIEKLRNGCRGSRETVVWRHQSVM